MKAYKVMAKNLKTHVRLQRQDLRRHVTNEQEAWQLAREFAAQQQQRGEDQWVAEVSTYQVSQ